MEVLHVVVLVTAKERKSYKRNMLHSRLEEWNDISDNTSLLYGVTEKQPMNLIYDNNP